MPNLDVIQEFAVDEAYLGSAYTYQLNGILYRTDQLDADEGAYAFIDYVLSAEAQAANVEAVGDLSVHPDVDPPEVMVDLAGEAASDPIAAGYETLDPEVIVANRDDWVQRFAREVVG